MTPKIEAAEYIAAARKEKERRTVAKAEKSFREFIKQSWPAVEPGKQYLHNWHIDCVADHLEACAKGQIKRLIMNFSPRSGKSIACAIDFPAWTWINAPAKKFIYSSYDLRLSRTHSLACRDLIKSDWYQRNWGSRYAISKTQDQKERFDNTARGFRMATSVDAGVTGEGADFIFYDDPNDPGKMNSEAYIDSVIYYHDHVMASRLNDPKTGVRICIQQRCGERDMTGHVLANESGWEHIVIPNEYEGKRPATVLGWEDPRKKMGELFWEERIGPAETATLKKKASYAGQYQQRPAPAEGAKFRREWWNFYNMPGEGIRDAAGNLQPVRVEVGPGKFVEKMPLQVPEAFEQIVQGWDFAFRDDKEHDLAAGHVWGRVGSNTFLLSRRTGHWDFPETKRQVREMSVEFPCPEKMIENKANGPAIIQSLRNEIPGLIESPIDRGLQELANSMTPYVEAGNVYLPNPDFHPWVKDLMDQFAMFPSGAHDDDIAAGCHALRRLYESMANAGLPEFRVVPRVGEPTNACHIEEKRKMQDALEPHWRRWVAISPGEEGAAVWMCETPSGSLRIYREKSLAGIDAHRVGLVIAEASLPEARAYRKFIGRDVKMNLDMLMEKECFAPIESIGCYAELVEDGIAAFQPIVPDYDLRLVDEAAMKMVRFRAEQIDVVDACFDRLREMLRFAPPDFKVIKYDRQRAIGIARDDVYAYQKYIAAVNGKVHGEWPKIKVANKCKGTIAALGSARTQDARQDHFLRAVLIGMAAPNAVPQKSNLEVMPLKHPQMVPRQRFQGRMMARRAM